MVDFNDFRNLCINTLGIKQVEKVEKFIEECIKYDLDPDSCTCIECKHLGSCNYEFDIYNTDGDCLMEK